MPGKLSIPDHVKIVVNRKETNPVNDYSLFGDNDSILKFCKDVLSLTGIPLNANRCALWMGQVHQASAGPETPENLIRD